MAAYKKYPVYEYDEPATYDDFKGGVNLDPSSENLLDNEMMDAVNMHYTHTTLRKRRGAKKKCSLVCDDTLNFIQGTFMFTSGETFIVLAADGKLYYSVYYEDTSIELRRLHIYNDYNDINTNAKNQFCDLDVLNYLKGEDSEHNGYVYQKTSSDNPELIFQNKYDIESAAYDDKLYIATGTRIVVVSVENETDLVAKCIDPYEPDGEEYLLYGQNYLSPFPYINIKESSESAGAFIKNVICKPVYEKNISTGNYDIVGLKYSAVMLYPDGSSASDYYFKWEKYVDNGNGKYEWQTILPFSSDDSLGYSELLLSKSGKEGFIAVDEYNIKIRCKFASAFSNTTEKNSNDEYIKETENGDYVPETLDGSYSGSYTAPIPDIESFTKTSDTWRIIQSCKKILADGNKFLYYDDAYNSGQWYKTFVNKPNYISDKGGLNFKTSKNEHVMRAVHFKGVIVVFAYNDYVGGNISVVSGNGDDDSSDSSYSPYIRSVVNSEIGCDNANTIQIAGNMLLFKFKDTVYALSGSDLSSEIISVYSMNTKLKMKDRTVDVPWNEDCVSEITRDYYALIWKEKITVENGEVFVERPAMRLKMYYNIGQEVDGKTFFPWLRDEGSVFNVDKVLYIDGISTHLRNMTLIQYEEEIYTDLGDSYDVTIKLKAYDLNYPKIIKLIKNVILYYHRGQYSNISVSTEVKNEAGYSLVSSTDTTKSLQDLPSVKDGLISGKLATTVTDTKVYTPEYMHKLLQAIATITIKCDDSFVFNSITFIYYTTDTPEVNMFDEYSKISHKTTPLSFAVNNSKTPQPISYEQPISIPAKVEVPTITETEKATSVFNAGSPEDRL